jgi:hypothetical protein
MEAPISAAVKDEAFKVWRSAFGVRARARKMRWRGAAFARVNLTACAMEPGVSLGLVM